MISQVSFLRLLSFSILLLSIALEAHGGSPCKRKLLETTQRSDDHFKESVLSILAKEYLQKRADLASESLKERELIVRDLKARAGVFYDEHLKTLPEGSTSLESSLVVQTLIQKMKSDDLHFLEEKRLILVYENLIGYLTNLFHWKIKSAQARRFLNGTQIDSEKEFVTEVVNEHIIKIFLNGVFDRSRNDATSERAKFFFLAMVLKGKVQDAIRKHLASNRTPEKPQFSIDTGFDLRARPEAIKFDSDLYLKVQRAMEKLSPDEREILQLVYDRGLSLAEAASYLEKKIGTLKSSLSRTLTKLRRILASQEIDYATSTSLQR